MIFKGTKTERLIDDKQNCDMQRAKFDDQMSGISPETAEDVFYATTDRIRFKRFFDIIKPVLEANGYVANFENMLACYDSLTMAILAKGIPADAAFDVSVFNDCIQFHLPSKSNVGPLLTMFYGEVENYEAQLVQISQLKAKAADGGEKESRRSLQDRFDKLKQDNGMLRNQLAELSSQLKDAQKSHANASKALEAENMLPEGLQVAVVKAINLDDRDLQLRAGRKSITVPLAMVSVVPEIGSKCIVKVRESTVEQLFFYQGVEKPQTTTVGKVLYCHDGSFKFRDGARNVRTIRAKNEAERQVIAGLQRGTELLVHLIGNTLIRFEPCQGIPARRFIDRLQEKIVGHDLRELPPELPLDMEDAG